MCCVTEPGKAAEAHTLWPFAPKRRTEGHSLPSNKSFVQESNVCHRQDDDERKADEQVQLVQKKGGLMDEDRDIGKRATCISLIYSQDMSMTP